MLLILVRCYKVILLLVVAKCGIKLCQSSETSYQSDNLPISCLDLPSRRGCCITYGNIMRYCECKLCIQCVKYAHGQKAQAQYISKVLMKSNAKLGGFTNTVFGPVTSKKAILDNSVVIIGADVSHAAHGLNGTSMAAMTVSMNAKATRYAADVETNGNRVEVMTNENIEKHFASLIKNDWSRIGRERLVMASCVSCCVLAKSLPRHSKPTNIS